MSSREITFVAGETGQWKVRRQSTVKGDPWPAASWIDIQQELVFPGEALWALRGISSNTRYVLANEKLLLQAKQPELNRPEATFAALIPIRKSEEWWGLTPEIRRGILEEQSHHIQTGLDYLPEIARRLHHCRDLSDSEPFDFLTWFEYSPKDEELFDELLVKLRASAEWQFVTREVDLRLERH